MVVVADTSALTSLGTTTTTDPPPLDALMVEYDVLVPEQVVAELERIASYDDEHGAAAGRVLDRIDSFVVVETELDTSFPLDDGENAAVTVANARAADLFLCDEFNELALVHASLERARLITTPTLLRVFVQRGVYSRADACRVLDSIGHVRSWEGNSYVRRVRETLGCE